jgi:hypothetical protein
MFIQREPTLLPECVHGCPKRAYVHFDAGTSSRPADDGAVLLIGIARALDRCRNNGPAVISHLRCRSSSTSMSTPSPSWRAATSRTRASPWPVTPTRDCAASTSITTMPWRNKAVRSVAVTEERRSRMRITVPRFRLAAAREARIPTELSRIRDESLGFRNRMATRSQASSHVARPGTAGPLRARRSRGRRAQRSARAVSGCESSAGSSRSVTIP